MNGNGSAPDVVTPDRMAPHSVEAEESVLGAVLLNPESYPAISNILTTDDFFITRNGWVWEAFVRILGRNEEIDNVTAVEELSQQGRLEEIGGAAYITYLINHTPSSIYTETYANIVARAAIRRRMLGAASEIAQLAHEESGEIDSVVDAAEAALFRVTQQRRRTTSARLSNILIDVGIGVKDRMESEKKTFGISTGFKVLDDIGGGWQKSDLIIVAGRPGMGKTSKMLCNALHAARAGVPVAIFTLEMSKAQLVQRLIAMETKIPTTVLRTKSLSAAEYKTFKAAVETLAKLPIFIDDDPTLTPQSLRSKARVMYSEHGIGLVCVDYLQLMEGGEKFRRGGENRTQEISFISRQAKVLARELDVPVLMLSQLNRELEKRNDKRPKLHDLRQSGSIEQDADIVIFIYRDEVYNEGSEFAGQAEVRYAKHRNGPTGTATLMFDPELTKFSDAVRTDVDFSNY